MKKFITSALALGALASPAMATDLLGSAPDTNDWSGAFIGLNAGVASSDVDLSMSTAPSSGYVVGDTYFQETSVPFFNELGRMGTRDTRFTWGMQAGYNFQHGKTVFGLESDINYLGLNYSESAQSQYPCCANFDPTIQQDVSINWLGTLRGRLGYSSEKFMVYGTGGMAYGKVNYTGSFSDTSGISPTASVSAVQVGWAAGAGLERMISKKTSIKFDYLHYDLGEVSGSSEPFANSAGTFPNTTFSHDAKVSGNIVRAGLNWHFN